MGQSPRDNSSQRRRGARGGSGGARGALDTNYNFYVTVALTNSASRNMFLKIFEDFKGLF
jgi:hypothetical protein